jgi:energy-coupling factor transporter ATP-binding protein EcfA2
VLLNFQKSIYDEIKLSLASNNFLVLDGPVGNGKSTLINYLLEENEIEEIYDKYLFTSGPEKSHTTYSGIPDSLIKNFKSRIQGKSLRTAITADFANILIAGFTSIAFPNMMSSLLNTNDKFEAEGIFEYLMKDIGKKKVILVFDHIDYYSKLAYAVMQLCITNLGQNTNYKIILILDNHSIEESEYRFLNKYSPKSITLNNPELSNEELSKLEISELMNLCGKIPLSQLIDLKDQNAEQKLEKLSKAESSNPTLNMNLIFSSVIFGRYATIDEFFTFLPNETDFEVNSQISELRDKEIFHQIEHDSELLFRLNPSYVDSVEKKLPQFLIDNRRVILSKYLNENSPFDYYRKFLNYKSMNYSEASFTNAVHYYCMASRNEIVTNTEEMSNIHNYFVNQSSIQERFFERLVTACKVYNEENYKSCLELIDEIIEGNNLHYENLKQGLNFPFPWPVLGEIFYLRALCLARFSDDKYSPPYSLTIGSLKLILSHVLFVNTELSIRLKEAIFVLLVNEKEKGVTSDNKNSTINSYIRKRFFNICKDYSKEIQNCNPRTYKSWRYRYAFHLSRINSIDCVPDKDSYFGEAYRIIKDCKEINSNNFIRVGNNTSVDFLWRSHYKKSLQIIEDVISFIKNNSLLEHWGNVLVNSWFIELYSKKRTPDSVLQEYKTLIETDSSILQRTHEKDLVNSNIAIIFAANYDFSSAYKLLTENENLITSSYSKYIYLTNKGALQFLMGNYDSAIRLENESFDLFKREAIPYFTPIFIEERYDKLISLYKRRERAIDNVLQTLVPEKSKRLTTGYTSDLYMKLMIFSDVNYWAN